MSVLIRLMRVGAKLAKRLRIDYLSFFKARSMSIKFWKMKSFRSFFLRSSMIRCRMLHCVSRNYCEKLLRNAEAAIM